MAGEAQKVIADHDPKLAALVTELESVARKAETETMEEEDARQK
jgi:uncharacterized protein (DUF2249 family)